MQKASIFVKYVQIYFILCILYRKDENIYKNMDALSLSHDKCAIIYVYTYMKYINKNCIKNINHFYCQLILCSILSHFEVDSCEKCLW